MSLTVSTGNTNYFMPVVDQTVLLCHVHAPSRFRRALTCQLANSVASSLTLSMENQLHAFRFTYYGTTRQDPVPTDILIYLRGEVDDFYLRIVMQVA